MKQLCKNNRNRVCGSDYRFCMYLHFISSLQSGQQPRRQQQD